MTPIRALSRQPPVVAVVVAAGVGLFTLVACMRLGAVGLLMPLVAVAVVALLQRPGLALGVLVALVVVCENRDPGLLPVLVAFYAPLPGKLTAEELLFALVLVALALELLRKQRPVRLPSMLTLPLALLVLATVGGAVTGHFAGAGATDLFFALRQMPYLVLVPLVVVNLVETRREVHVILTIGAGLAVLKAVLGLVAVGAGRGTTVEGATITYYEPVANWLMLLLLLGTLAAFLLHARPPLWVVLGSPLMLASLALSFRRSFWIGVALGLLLVLVLGLSPLGRRLLMPTAALVAAAVWVLASIGFQSEGPLAERAASLKPSRIEANAEDRYRLDERANVLAEIRSHPITGLGVAIPWRSVARSLPVEHENGRDYVHSVALYYWLKLGLLGVVAYIAMMVAAGWMAFSVWRRHHDALLRAVGLTSLCALIALAVIETTGSFTGVDLRFTVALGVLFGLLAVLRRDLDAPLPDV